MKTTNLALIGIFFIIVTQGCGKRIVDAPPPEGCVAVVFTMDSALSAQDLREIESFARNLYGETPYPEVSFEMAKGVSGKTAYRATRVKDSVDIEALEIDIDEWISSNFPNKVEVKIIK